MNNPKNNPKPTYAEYLEMIRTAVDAPVPQWVPLKVKMVRPEIQEKMDAYRKIKSLY